MVLTTKTYIIIGVLVTVGILCGKHFWYDRLPTEAKASTEVGSVALPTADNTSSADATNMTKMPIPTEAPVPMVKGGPTGTWWQMPWNSQMGAHVAFGGTQVMEGSLMAESGLELKIESTLDCNKMLDEVMKFCQDYKSDPNTPVKMASFMGDGMPYYFSVAKKLLEPLGPEYQLCGFMAIGRSKGEDRFVGPPSWKENAQNAIGGTVALVLRDGDMNIVLKWAGDNRIPVNPDEKTYDPKALNLIAASDFLDAANKYTSNYKDPNRRIIVNGMVTSADTSLGVDAVATWTPGDVNIAEQKGGLVTIASTFEYSSQMPNITVTCRKWLMDHSDAVSKMIVAIGEGGAQVNAFNDVKLYAAKISSEVYKDQNAAYWAKYYKGVKTQDVAGLDVELGGSMAFNLADQANMLGLGKDKIDRYSIVYTKFGDILKKMYPEYMAKYPPYNEVIDKRYLINALAMASTTAVGEETEIAYADEMTDVMAKADYHIEFEFAKDKIDPKSYKDLNDIASTAMIAETQKIRVEGHTDNVGDDRSNMELSERRAQSVRDYLIQKGVKASRIETEGKGESEPVQSNSTKAGQQANRRVRIIIGH